MTKLSKLGEDMTKLSEEERKLVNQAMKRMKNFAETMPNAGTVLTTITEVLGKKGAGPAGQRVSEMKKKDKKGKGGKLIQPASPSPKGKLAMVKGGGLMEATARLKAKGMKEGGMVVKDKTVAMDKSPNSGLITTKGFGASRRT